MKQRTCQACGVRHRGRLSLCARCRDGKKAKKFRGRLRETPEGMEGAGLAVLEFLRKKEKP